FPVIVFQIDILHVFAVYAERDPVVAAHPNAPFAAPIAPQWVQLPNRKRANLLDALCLLDRVENVFHLGNEIGPNAATGARFIETPQPLVAGSSGCAYYNVRHDRTGINIIARHCERSEAIQFCSAALDCFVATLLAMTALPLRPLVLHLQLREEWHQRVR